jgi:peptidoglycan/LPS O-acetylase OafA/YrhL
VNDQEIAIPPLEEPRSDGVRILRKVDALDGFRGIAVVLVLLVHIPVAVPWLFNRVIEGGGFGVDAFFVLSGFLITAILLRDQAHGGAVRLGAFYRRRAMRLLPALLTFIVIFLYYAWITSLPGDNASSVLSIIFYYSNTWLHRGAMWPGLGHMWSLALEEQFYLLWPLCLTLFFGLRRRLTPTVVLLVAAIAIIAIRRGVLYNHGVSWLWLYTRLATRADAMLVGCLLAQLWVRGKVPRRGVQLAGWLALAYFLYIVWAGAGGDFLYRGGYTLIAVAIGIVLLAVLETDWLFNRVLRVRPLRAVGRVSYGLYIWHLPIFTVVARYDRTWNPFVQTIVALGFTALATYGSWALVERPFLRWKDRLEVRPDHDTPSTTRKPSRNPSFRHVTIRAPH